MKNKQPKILIIGGGPTGLGAAWHLKKIGYENWALYERNAYFGGLSATHKDEKGFLWDEGGHVLFSHYPYFDDFIGKILGKDYLEHQRESWIKLANVWVPYPFQNNIRYLAPEDQLKCIAGLFEAQKNKKKKNKNFQEWILSTFGPGIAEVFMFKSNESSWAFPIEKMSHQWISERVSVIDAGRALANIIFKRDDVSWGPNNKFMFPLKGGTGEIYARAAEFLGDNLKTNKEVSGVDLRKKRICFKDSSEENFDCLISSIPLDKFARIAKGLPAALAKAANKLVYNSLYQIGIGLEKKIETTKCWVYFPEKEDPFYRMTFFHHYSPNNVPGGETERYSSLMCEISYSKFKNINKERLIEDCIEALLRNRIIGEADKKKIVSKAVYDIKYSYPVPTLERDRILKKIQPFLMRKGIYSRGRFGAWKYEIGNMDHCFMQGVEAVENILNNKKETIWS